MAQWISAHHQWLQGSHLTPLTTIHTCCSIAPEGEEVIGEEKLEYSYIMANALCPCAVSAGRWCIAQQSRANGQMKQGRAGGMERVLWRNTG